MAGLGFLQRINQGLQNQSPQQRAMMLRAAAGASRNPVMAQGLAQQADDYIGISEQAKINSLRQKQFDTQMELRREQLQMQKDEASQRQARSDAFRTDMQKWLTAQTPEDRQGVLSSSTSPEFLEYVASQKPSKPNAFDAKLLSMGLTPGTPEWVAAAREMALKPDTTINMGLQKPDRGYMWRDPNNPAAGEIPIPGGPAEGRTPEQGAKEQMLQVAKDQFPRIEQILFNQDGSINRKALTMSVGGGVPFTQGRSLANAYEVGIQAITRNETGAAMPPEEVNNTRTRFQPGPFDTDELIKIKHQMYKDFIDGGLSLIRMDKGGTPKFDTAAYDAELQRRMSDSPPSQDDVVDWSDL